MESGTPNCARCPFKIADRFCKIENGKNPSYCPTKNLPDLIERCLKKYDSPDVYEFAKQAAIQEADGYANRELGYEHIKPSKLRIEEIVEFSGKMNYERPGPAFCDGFIKEAKIVEKLISGKGVTVVSAMCKVGRVPKEKVGVTDGQKLSVGAFETMCNPVMQALILNNEKTDFNILLGLCVGHDSLFFKYAEAPCTVLAVKDRLLGHNPMAAIYNIDSYYKSIK
jgi:uncharacterized metal-binding protein